MRASKVFEALLVSASLASADDKEDICYGLSLSDASDIGPYQAGALIGLLKH